MAKTVTVDRVKVIAEMARQNLTGEELAQKAGTGNSAIYKMRKGQPVWLHHCRPRFPCSWRLCGKSDGR